MEIPGACNSCAMPDCRAALLRETVYLEQKKRQTSQQTVAYIGRMRRQHLRLVESDTAPKVLFIEYKFSFPLENIFLNVCQARPSNSRSWNCYARVASLESFDDCTCRYTFVSIHLYIVDDSVDESLEREISRDLVVT